MTCFNIYDNRRDVLVIGGGAAGLRQAIITSPGFQAPA